MINSASVQAGRLHGDGLGVGGSPVEDAIVVILRIRSNGEGAHEYRDEDGKMLHIKSIGRVLAGA